MNRASLSPTTARWRCLLVRAGREVQLRSVLHDRATGRRSLRLIGVCRVIAAQQPVDDALPVMS